MKPVTPELLPCPFCGGEASDTGHVRYSKALTDTEWLDGTPIVEAFHVNCMACGAVSRGGFVGGYQTKADAITAWNTRSQREREIADALADALRGALWGLAPWKQDARAALATYEAGRGEVA